MLNLESIETVYIACGCIYFRKSIDGLILEVESNLKLDPFEKALFVFCNREMNRLKILHFDEGFWIYYHRIEHGRLKWPLTNEEALAVNKEEFKWLLKGYELRIKSKSKPVKEENYY